MHYFYFFSRGGPKDNPLLQIEWVYYSNSPVSENIFLGAGDNMTPSTNK
jgi:hypothetical protein